MHHVLVHAASTRIVELRPNRKIVISELAPDAQDLHGFSVVAVYQKVVLHGLVRLLRQQPSAASTSYRMRRSEGLQVLDEFSLLAAIRFNPKGLS
jgi:hypothetical protein